MKRRSFLAAVAGLFAAPKVALALPVDDVPALPFVNDTGTSFSQLVTETMRSQPGLAGFVSANNALLRTLGRYEYRGYSLDDPLPDGALPDPLDFEVWDDEDDDLDG